MSVYTTVEPAQLEQFLTRYELGKLQNFSAITTGITNTNYYLDTEAGCFVLTLYEHHSDDELTYMLGLQQHLVNRSLHCSSPVADRRGALFSTLNQRPAAIINRLDGEVRPQPESVHCAIIGAEMARFHLVGQDYPGKRTNPRGIDWIIAVTDMLDTSLNDADLRLIKTTLHATSEFDPGSLPRGSIHADLFRDNVLFRENELGGILDFDYACSDSFVFDIAVLLNDWCIDNRGLLVAERISATLEAYQQHRRLEAAEIDSLPYMLCVAALRFWLSRLYDKAFPLSGELTFTKDPETFREMLVLRRLHQPEIKALLTSLQTPC
ncbi:MAG: homoserine kinase [Gammaproteobacteria bacterium]|nr:homoserine kinase [Gammaproteobacteria bacterium]MDH3857315.1 homoserine kinase [Gammaproteobacteria bacterium]